ncbi:unnamed protein product, partial [marine sediment metagenome]
MSEDLATVEPTEITTLEPAEKVIYESEQLSKVRSRLVEGKDVIDYGGKPYTAKGGLRKMATAFSVSLEIVRNPQNNEPVCSRFEHEDSE